MVHSHNRVLPILISNSNRLTLTPSLNSLYKFNPCRGPDEDPCTTLTQDERRNRSLGVHIFFLRRYDLYSIVH